MEPAAKKPKKGGKGKDKGGKNGNAPGSRADGGKDGGADRVLATEAIAHAKAMMQEYLDEATAASKYEYMIKTYALSSEVGAEMKQHAKAMQKMYKKVGKLISQECQDPEVYETHIYSVARPMQRWFQQRSEVAKGMTKAITKGAKKAGKKEAAEDDGEAGKK